MSSFGRQTLLITSQIFCCILLSFGPAYAGWSGNVRLTFSGFELNPQVIARGDTVHIVWFEMAVNGISNVSYIRSTDGGNSWGPIVVLNASNHRAQYSTLNLAERGLLVSWLDYNITQGLSCIAIAKSADGEIWDPPSYVATQNPNNFNQPTSAVKGDSIFLAYYSYRDDSTGFCPLKSKHSYNYGAGWSSEVTVWHPISVIPQPIRMAYCSGSLLLASSCVPDSNHLSKYYIIGNRSTDAGVTWSDSIWISPNIPYAAQGLCLACNRITSQILAIYDHDRFQTHAFHGDVFAAISNDGGFTWPNEYQATFNHTAWWPSADFVADTLITVWSDKGYDSTGTHEIVINRSNDGGANWQGEERITNTPDESYDPWISFDNGKIHVVWREEVGGLDSDIFYKKFTPDSIIDNVEEPNILPPSDFDLSAYPNPFNSSTTLSTNIDYPITIYDITGKQITTLHAQQGKAIWDASGCPSGIYFAKVQAGGKAQSIKLILLK